MGRLLIEAKERLPHGEFSVMVTGDLGWNLSAAQRLMRIARNEVLAKAATLPLLPPSREVLYTLARLSTEKLSEAIEKGAVTPALSMNEANSLLHGSAYLRSKCPVPGPTVSLVDLSDHIPSSPLPPPTPEEQGAELARQVDGALHEIDPQDQAPVLRALIRFLVPHVMLREIQAADFNRRKTTWLDAQDQPIPCFFKFSLERIVDVADTIQKLATGNCLRSFAGDDEIAANLALAVQEFFFALDLAWKQTHAVNGVYNGVRVDREGLHGLVGLEVPEMPHASDPSEKTLDVAPGRAGQEGDDLQGGGEINSYAADWIRQIRAQAR